MELKIKRIITLACLAMLLWTAGQYLGLSFQPDTTYYMAQMLYYSGMDLDTACKTTYFSEQGSNVWTPERIMGLQDLLRCREHLKYYSQRGFYPFVSSLFYRVWPSYSVLAILPLLSFILLSAVFYLLFAMMFSERQAFYGTVLFLCLPIVFIRVAARYLTDSTSILMWVFTTFLFYRYLKGKGGMLILLPVFFVYLWVKENVIFLAMAFILTLLLIRRYKDAAKLAGIFVAAYALFSITPFPLPTKPPWELYLFTFYGHNEVWFDMPQLTIQGYLENHIGFLITQTNVLKDRFLYHLNVLLIFAAVGFAADKNKTERILFCALFLAYMMQYILYPFPESRLMVYVVPSFIYFSIIGYDEARRWLKDKKTPHL